MATIDEKIKALEIKLKQEKERKQKMESAKRAAETKAVRAADTRKKILLGSFLLKNFPEPLNLKVGDKHFIDTLIRADDRAIFGLEPLPKSEAAPVQKDTVVVPAEQAAPVPEKAGNFSDSVTVLNVRYDDRNEAKALGAIWSMEGKSWSVPAGRDLTPFKKFLENK